MSEKKTRYWRLGSLLERERKRVHASRFYKSFLATTVTWLQTLQESTERWNHSSSGASTVLCWSRESPEVSTWQLQRNSTGSDRNETESGDTFVSREGIKPSDFTVVRDCNCVFFSTALTSYWFTKTTRSPNGSGMARLFDRPSQSYLSTARWGSWLRSIHTVTQTSPFFFFMYTEEPGFCSDNCGEIAWECLPRSHPPGPAWRRDQSEASGRRDGSPSRSVR